MRNMKKHLSTALTLTSLLVGIVPRRVFAQADLNQGDVEGIFGTIDKPEAVAKYDAAAAAGGAQLGLILFLSNIIRIATIVAGIWVMINFVIAGWLYITSNGEAKVHTDAANRITYSIIGLAIIVGSYTLAALVGLLVFGDASYILSPTITGPAGVGG